eukprot:3022136-Amphidinium_carterae.1
MPEHTVSTDEVPLSQSMAKCRMLRHGRERFLQQVVVKMTKFYLTAQDCNSLPPEPQAYL